MILPSLSEFNDRPEEAASDVIKQILSFPASPQTQRTKQSHNLFILKLRARQDDNPTGHVLISF
jgi:hypothetical protein